MKNFPNIILLFLLIISFCISNRSLSQSQNEIEDFYSALSSDNQNKHFNACISLAEYYMYNNNDSCDKYLAIAEKLAYSNDNNSQKGEYFLAASRVEKLRSNFNTALEKVLKASEYFNSVSNNKGALEAKIIISDLYALKGNYEESINIYSEIIESAQQDGFLLLKVNALIGLGNVYYYTDNFEQSRSSFEEAVYLSEKFNLGEARTKASLYTNYGSLNLTLKDFINSVNFYRKGFDKYFELNDKYRMSLVAYNLGDAFLGLNEYDSAKKYFNINLFLGLELNNLEEIKFAYKGFTNLYEQQGDYRSALESFYKYVAYSDSTRNNQYSADLEAITQKFKENEKLRNAEKNLEHSEIIREKQGQLNLIFGIGFILLLIATMVIFLLYFRSIRIRKLLEKTTVEFEKKNLQLDKTLHQKEILLQEVHHRVKNNLQLIASLLNLQLSNLEDETAIKAIEECKSRVQAIALMHKGLYQDDNYNFVDLVSYINELVDNLKTISSNSERMVQFELEVDPIKLSIDYSVPIGLILSELISNSLKHAFNNQPEGKIKIDLKSRNNKTVLLYSDNGCGLPQKFNIEDQETLGFTVISSLTEQIGGTLTFLSYQPFSLELRF